MPAENAEAQPRARRRPSAPAARTTGPALEAMYQFLLWLIPTLEKFPRSQKFLLGDRLQSQALAVLDHLIAATFSRERSAHLRAANLELEKLRFGLRLAKDLQHIDFKRYEFSARALDEVGRMVGGWLKTQGTPQASSGPEARLDEGRFAAIASFEALQRYEQYRDQYRHVLRADIWRYFPSIDHAVRFVHRLQACMP